MAIGRGDSRTDDVDLDRRTQTGPCPCSGAAMVEDGSAGDRADSSFREACTWSYYRVESLSRRKIQRRLQELSRRSAIAPGFITKRKDRIRCRRSRFQNGRLQQGIAIVQQRSAFIR